MGDWVIADDPTTPGEIEARQVLDTFVRETDALVDLYVDGEVISTTGEHPFWTPDQGWVEAKDLHVGSLLQTEDGRVIDVDGVEKREGHFQVYNFKVEGFHTYYVSDLGILVHNAVCPPTISPGYDPDSFRGIWSSIGDDSRPPIVMGTKTPDGGVEISDVFRRGNPPGFGGEMIARTLEGAGVPRPTRIRITDIQEYTNQPTFEAVTSGREPQGTPLGNALENAIRELGGTSVGPWKFGQDRRGKVWIEKDITY